MVVLMSRPFYPQGNIPGRSWVGPKALRKFWADENTFVLAETETRFLYRPTRSLSTVPTELTAFLTNN